MKGKEEILESGLLEQYVLGLTSPEENQVVQRAIIQYPELKDHLDMLERTMESIAKQHAIVPPAELKSKTLETIRQYEKMNLPHQKSRTILEVVGGILGIFLIASTFSFYNSSKQYRSDLEAKSEALIESELALANLRESCDQNSRLLGLYEDPSYTNVILRHQNYEDQKVSVFWSGNNKECFLRNISLPAPPTGKVYQIWADVDQKMLPVGIFNESTEVIPVKGYENATSLNVTIEPAGGSEHPTVANLIMSIGV